MICLILLTHCARRAASRADWTAGSSKAISTGVSMPTLSEGVGIGKAW